MRRLIRREEERLRASTPGCAAMFRRAADVLTGGVASSYQLRDPWPIYLSRASGSSIWDVDGGRRLDFHNGFGAMVQGHAHPAIGRAVSARHAKGAQLGATTEDAVVVAEELTRRWRLPRWRYTTSGTEATMDAIRIARAYAGRDVIMKILGSYHGHHDAVMSGAGIPHAFAELTVAVPFNDADAMERRIEELERQGRKPACVIMEPTMMLGMALAEPGYLEAVREITRRNGIVLIFDEVKTGLSVAAGGATERYGVAADLVTLAKTLGGGLPCGAVGGTEEVMSLVEDGTVDQAGTDNGNPLSMAAARANLFEVLTPAAFVALDAVNRRMIEGCNRVLAEHCRPGYAHGVGARGCVTFSPVKIIDYATFTAHEDRELRELVWLYNANRGIYTTPARPEQWTLSVAHSDDDVDAYVGVFSELVAELAG